MDKLIIILAAIMLSSCARLHVAVVDKNNPERLLCEASSITFMKDFGKPEFKGCGMKIGADDSVVAEMDGLIGLIGPVVDAYLKTKGL